MAGSQAEQTKFIDIATDPVLAARMESVRLLADQLREPVAVIDRSCNIIYANRPAFEDGSCRVPGEAPSKCYAAFFGRSEPCSFCPAKEVFKSGEQRSVPCSTGKNDTSCGLIQAFPLTSADGTAAYVLEILKAKGEMSNGATQSDDPVPVDKGLVPLHPPAPAASRRSPSPSRLDEAQLRGLIGRSEPMQQLFEMVQLVADSQATVLLQGESGTGKELVARTIHNLSYRRDRPFVVVDCGSLPETLLESELFGHVKGAFTGAVSSTKGLFEEADGGTIFLDEIADTTLHFQSKLLRVLQEGEIKPVGSCRSIKVDVRIISATNKDLFERIKSKAFREDLYYRLAVLPLLLPPLRDRREDIPLLVRHFVEASCKRHRKPLREVTPEAMQGLIAAPWAGNVRELQHTIERAVVTAPGPQLTRQDFFGPLTSPVADTDLRSVARKAAQIAERARIQEALHQASGKRTRAAHALKISRASLYNKLRAYQLE